MQKVFSALALLAAPLFIGAYLLLDARGERATEEKRDTEVTEEVTRSGNVPDTHFTDDEEGVFEALVVLRDQAGTEAEALKRGDVLAVRKSPHSWSSTEEQGYLIVKLETRGKDARALLEPKKDGETIVLPRKRRIDLTLVGFAGESVLGGQPFRDRTFGVEIVNEK